MSNDSRAMCDMNKNDNAYNQTLHCQILKMFNSWFYQYICSLAYLYSFPIKLSQGNAELDFIQNAEMIQWQ